jgi:DNA-binding beta-propeller fold protein YncE
VNHEADSVTIFAVNAGNTGDPLRKVAEVPVGGEPTCVAVHPQGDVAFVINSADATASVVALTG